MNHSIGVTMKFADFAAGGSDHPRTPPGDLVGRDHLLALRSAAGAARAAWASADMARPCHLPFGTFPASLAAGINLFDVLAHTWDIAAATGVVLECPDELWQAGLELDSMQAIWRLTPRQSVAAECRRRGKPAVVSAVAQLRNDQVPRVRAAAERAIVILTASGT
jgi:uncharacterized protein (TIGR03086 family)